MKTLKKIKDKWVLTDGEEEATIHHFIHEPEMEEVETPYVVFEQVTNFARIYFTYGWDPDNALYNVINHSDADFERLCGVEEVIVEFPKKEFYFTATMTIEAHNEEEAKEIFSNNSEDFAASAECEENEV